MSFRVLAVCSAVLALLPGLVSAQTIGTFRWQLQPFCNVITLHVVQQGPVFTMTGFDDQCGTGPRAGIVGTAFPNPDGTIGIALNTVLAPGGMGVQIGAHIRLASLDGPWRDNSGQAGTLTFTPGAGSGGPQRPVSGPMTLGYELVQGPNVTLAPNAYTSAYASCPAGKKVLGGGGSNSSRGLVVLTDSFPAGENLWGVYMQNNSAQSLVFRAFAICATIP